ncbi:hypothetical protein L195_g018276, partial [Trifolium pratense]
MEEEEEVVKYLEKEKAKIKRNRKKMVGRFGGSVNVVGNL